MPVEHMPYNPPPFTPDKPGPAHVPFTTNDEIRHTACVWADWGLDNRGHFTYTETAARSHMFLSKPGTLSQQADCSQFYAALLHWSGATAGLHGKKPLDQWDYTGSLLQKGKHLTVDQVRPGDAVIFGPGTGAHAGFVRERVSTTDFWVIGFGHQGAPDRVKLSDLKAWFSAHAQPGVTFLGFLL